MTAPGGADKPGAGAPDIDLILSGIMLSRVDCELLARSLFDEKERLLQEGEHWEQLPKTARSYWLSLARALLFDLYQLKKQRAVGFVHTREPPA